MFSEFTRNAFKDPMFSLRVRAVVAPALTSTPAWAGELNRVTVGEIIDLLRAATLFGQLFGEVPILPSGVQSIRLPRRGAGSLSGGWIGEGQRIPVKAGTFTSFAMTPSKVAAITAASREMIGRCEFGAFIGEVEDAVLECKAAAYHFDDEPRQFELAKDVAAFANADGGVIVIGLETTKVPMTSTRSALERLSEDVDSERPSFASFFLQPSDYRGRVYVPSQRLVPVMR